MFTAFSLMLLGLVMLYFGAEGLVRGSSNLGLRFGISPLVVGLTIVAFGTSASELAVSMNAAHVGQTDISIANVIGSNIANIGLILGLTAMINPVTIDIKLIRIDIPIMIGTTLLLCILLIDSVISRSDGLLLISGVIVYTVFNVLQARKVQAKNNEVAEIDFDESTNNILKDVVFIIGGLVILSFGGKFLVDGAINIAKLMGVSEAVIVLTIVAVGTSLPEMATSILAAAKKMSDIAMGNVVG